MAITNEVTPVIPYAFAIATSLEVILTMLVETPEEIAAELVLIATEFALMLIIFTPTVDARVLIAFELA